MADLSKEYERILTEIEATVSNEQERQIVKQKVEELSRLFISNIEEMNNIINTRLRYLEESENNIRNVVNQLQKTVSEIEGDIYEGETEGEYDFEIVCPYCNSEFVADINMLNMEKNEIKCPECKNIIELDWNDEEETSGCASGCGGCHGCNVDTNYNDYDEDENIADIEDVENIEEDDM